jgi:hypothetical protein
MTTATPTRRRAAYAGQTDAPTTTRTEKGMSLAKGPALILGTILTAAGLYLLYKARTFPPFSNFPNGTVSPDGKFILGIFAANGWTAMLTAVGGALLLFGLAQHLLAKTMSLIVGVALGAAAIIGAVSGNVLGMAATNGWTEVAWGACAVLLLFNTLAPRRRREVVVADDAAAVGAAPAARRDEIPAEEEPIAAREAHRGYADEAREPMAEHDRGMAEDPAVAHDRGMAEDPAVAHDRGMAEDPTVAHDRGMAEDPTVAHDRG